MSYRYQLVRSMGVPRYAVWLLDNKTNKWHCWGEVNSPDDHPNLLDDINSGKYFNPNHTDKPDYSEVRYLLNDGNHCPNL